MADESRWSITGSSGHVAVRIHVAQLNQIDDIKQFGTAIDKAMAAHDATQVSLDFEAVEYISSGILGWLAALSKHLHDRSPAGRVHLYRLRPLIDQLCRQVCLDRAIEIHPPNEAPSQLT